MPLYNGNYTAPVWINNQPPAINETELLAMSQTIEASQILTGNGPPTQYISGTVGQRYADTSTTPYTIYKLAEAVEDANVWEPDDANGNLAKDYDTTYTYAVGEYCIHNGQLYIANTDFDSAEAWDPDHWDRVKLADQLDEHVIDVDNPHNVTAGQIGAYIKPDSGIPASDLADGVIPTVAELSLPLSWSGSGPFTQTVTVTGATVTENSLISLQPTAAQLASLYADGVLAITIENNAGTLTAYVLGAAPTSALTIDCTVTEVAT